MGFVSNEFFFSPHGGWWLNGFCGQWVVVVRGCGFLLLFFFFFWFSVVVTSGG